MQKKTHTGLQISGTSTRLEQVIAHLCIAQSSEDKPTCQVCDAPLREGDQITLYLYKPAGSGRYSIGQCRCRSHDDNLPSLFTLGVEELIVDGRIGQCRDHATQQAWPILLATSIRLISASDTSTGRIPTNTNQPDTTAWNHGQQLHERAETNHLSPNHQTDQTDIKVGGRQ